MVNVFCEKHTKSSIRNSFQHKSNQFESSIPKEVKTFSLSVSCKQNKKVFLVNDIAQNISEKMTENSLQYGSDSQESF